MNDTRCWYKLNIDVTNSIKKTGFSFPKATKDRALIWRVLANDIFDTTWISYMESIGLPVSAAMIFYRAALATDEYAHIDTGATFGLNWVIEGKDSEMRWYKTPDDILTRPRKTSMTDSIYVNWPVNELEEIDRNKIESTLTLVRVDVPHSIVVSDQNRLSISIRIGNGTKFKWGDIVAHMEKTGLLQHDSNPTNLES